MVVLFMLVSIAPAAASGRISIDVRATDINEVIALLAAQSHTNIVSDVSVKPAKVTLHLHDVTFEEALNALVSSFDLEVRRVDNMLIVGTSESMNRRYGPGGGALGAQTFVLSLVHANADDVAKQSVSALPEGTVVVPDKRTQSVIVTASGPTLARARVLVAALDARSLPHLFHRTSRTCILCASLNPHK